MKQYVQDRPRRPTGQVANTLAQLIIGGFLASTEVTDEVSGDPGETA
jgi:hypothetical protein